MSRCNLPENIAGAYIWVCLAADCRSKVCSFGQWSAANCAALPTASAGQYATSHCKPLMFWFPSKRPRYIIIIIIFTTEGIKKIIIMPAQCLRCCHHDSESLREFTRFTWWMQNSVTRPPTFGPSRQTWAAGPPAGRYETTSTIAIYCYSASKLILILSSHLG